jgi:hypothetical protein
MRHGSQKLAILALALSVDSGSTPAGPEGGDAARSASGALARAPSADVVATRGNAAAVGEFRFRPLGLSALRPPTSRENPCRPCARALGQPADVGAHDQGPGSRPAHERAIRVPGLRLFRWRLDPPHGLPAPPGVESAEGSARSRQVRSVVGSNGPHRAQHGGGCCAR